MNSDILNLLKELKKLEARLYVENGVLKLDIQKELLTDTLKNEIKENKETLIDLLSVKRNNEYEAIEKSERKLSYPLSEQQEQIWLACQMKNGSRAFNMPTYIEFGNDFEINKFKKAIYEVIKRYDILRTIFVNEDGIVRQKVISYKEFNFKILEKNLEVENDYNLVEKHIIEDTSKEFDLTQYPLFKIHLLKLSNNKFVVYYNLHHIICDGWSSEILRNEIFNYYKSDDISNVYSELDTQYSDYAVWQKGNRDKLYFKNKDFWKSKLDKGMVPLDLNFANPRPKSKKYEGRSESVILPKEYLYKLESIGKKEHITLYMHLLAISSLLLYKFSYQKNLVIGTAMSGRTHPDLENQLGCFVRSVPLFFNINQELDYSNYIKETQKTVLEARDNQDFSFHKLLKELNYRVVPSRGLLFDVVVVIDQNLSDVANSKSQVNPLRLEVNNSKHDLTFYFGYYGDTVSLSVVYNTILFEEKDIKSFVNSFLDLTRSVSEDSTIKIETLMSSLSDVEEDKEYKTFLDLVTDEISDDF
ncbi:condensation domain-containing protein [Aquimarina sp. Aq107]|uniref:condensation domain-containing protein n=1 Tax=Aquimarina sp. Aq107 TaxID=1191912 RepID=UPI00131EEA8C|nr:condensation domain-containing protein [Aquimarina sp. Aq107]